MGRYDDGYWKPYVPVGVRKAKAEREAATAKRSGASFAPVVVPARGAFTTTVWGKAWCDNLEVYSDYGSRLPRGRSYLRNGSVVDLKIEPGKVLAQVIGSHRYQVTVNIEKVATPRWNALVSHCTGSVASLVELLQGKLHKSVMEHLCAPKNGLFPSNKEIRFDCTCPDWANLCKHVAATLYGVGVRLDERPELLFTLRGVEASDLVAKAAAASLPKAAMGDRDRILDASALDVFGLDLATPYETPAEAAPSAVETPPVQPIKTARKAAKPKPIEDISVGAKPRAKPAKKAAKTSTGSRSAARSSFMQNLIDKLNKLADEPALKRKKGEAAPAPKGSKKTK
jgi:uncharacterized Zn finger protein